jgi:hypothetical protein
MMKILTYLLMQMIIQLVVVMVVEVEGQLLMSY